MCMWWRLGYRLFSCYSGPCDCRCAITCSGPNNNDCDDCKAYAIHVDASVYVKASEVMFDVANILMHETSISTHVSAKLRQIAMFVHLKSLFSFPRNNELVTRSGQQMHAVEYLAVHVHRPVNVWWRSRWSLFWCPCTWLYRAGRERIPWLRWILG